jgi:hypothetical protein
VTHPQHFPFSGAGREGPASPGTRLATKHSVLRDSHATEEVIPQRRLNSQCAQRFLNLKQRRSHEFSTGQGRGEEIGNLCGNGSRSLFSPARSDAIMSS